MSFLIFLSGLQEGESEPGAPWNPKRPQEEICKPNLPKHVRFGQAFSQLGDSAASLTFMHLQAQKQFALAYAMAVGVYMQGKSAPGAILLQMQA